MYFVLKLLHLIGVVVFLGNISLGVYWKYRADASGDLRIITHTIRTIILADRLFTNPGVILLVVAGLATAITGRIPILSTGWILWGIVLIIIAAVAYVPLSATQRALLAIASNPESERSALARYHELSKRWNLYGSIALAAPLIAFAFMVLKPALPAFHR
ncbi:MAG: DUF2269 family protein [Vulcanimicrobiaceae bacterium]